MYIILQKYESKYDTHPRIPSDVRRIEEKL